MKPIRFIKINIYQILFFSLLFGVTIFRFILSWKAPYWVDMTASYDDQLYIRYTQELLNANWLGSYTTTTLSKGISFSLFVFMANKLNVSYSVILGMLNILASLLAAVSLKPITKNKWIFSLIYTYFLFSPIGLMNDYSTRVYRNSIVVPTAVLIIACLIAIYFRKFWKPIRLLPWFIVLSIVFPFYWFIREDSIWLLPITVVSSLIVIFQILFQFRKKERMHQRLDIHSKNMGRCGIIKIFFFLLPILSFILATQWIENKNEEAYGVAITNDRTSGEFANLTKNLIRIDDGTDLNVTDSDVWVSHAALDKAISVSPTLSKIAPNISALYTSSPWTFGGKDKEIAGDIIFWALRDSANQAGYYNNNAKETNQFWENVNKDLNNAYKKGELKKKDEIYLTSTGDGKLKGDLPVVYDFMKTGYDYNLFYTDFTQGGLFSLGTKDSIEQAQNILKIPLINRWVDVEDPKEPDVEPTIAEGIANSIINMYQKTAYVLQIVVIIGVLITIIGCFFSKKNTSFFRSSLLIMFGLALTQFIFLLGVSWFCSWAPERRDLFMKIYAGAGVPVSQFIIVLSVISLTKLSVFRKSKVTE